jgi:glycosyltransferase involved in cell wall biosynthesis
MQIPSKEKEGLEQELAISSLSVIVPVFNCAAVVVDTIKSIISSIDFFENKYDFAQKVKSEIIIVNDCSTDDTLQILEETFSNVSGIKIISNSSNSGAATSRNNGVSNSQSDIIFFCDGDDFFLPEHIYVCFMMMQGGGSGKSHFQLKSDNYNLTINLPDQPIDVVRTGVKTQDKLHPYWKAAIENSIPLNLCVRRKSHNFVEGFPQDPIYKKFMAEDVSYQTCLSQFCQVVKLNLDTVEYMRYPGNNFDKQLEKFQLPPGEYNSESLDDPIVVKEANRTLQNKLAYLTEKQSRLNPKLDQNLGQNIQRAAQPLSVKIAANGDEVVLGVGWQINLTTGWGNYGLNLVLQLQQSPNFVPLLLTPPNISEGLNPLHRELLQQPLLEQQRLQQLIQQHRGNRLDFNVAVLHGLGNQFSGGNQNIRGSQNIGVIFSEDTKLLPDALARAKQYDLIIAGSTWNAEILESYGIQNVRTIFQGIDPAKFHPAPKSNLFKDRFVVFSGGKLEYRKGQDIVVAAFRQFASRHPDALLLTAWHNFWPQFMIGIDRMGHVEGIPKLTQNKQLLVKEWLVANGIPADACLDVGAIPNHIVGQVVREADVAVFTNRAEGGTNLVAMECLACGIPTIIAANTGHLDLVSDDRCYALRTQAPTQPNEYFAGVEGWGESDVEEVVEMLEQAYNNREVARQKGLAAAEFMQDWTWEKQINRFCNVLTETGIVK